MGELFVSFWEKNNKQFGETIVGMVEKLANSNENGLRTKNSQNRRKIVGKPAKSHLNC